MPPMRPKVSALSEMERRRQPLPLWTTDENQRWPAECLTEFASDLGARYVAEALLDGLVCVRGRGCDADLGMGGFVEGGLSTSAGGVRLCGGREPMTCEVQASGA